MVNGGITMIRKKLEEGQKLRKVSDGTIVTIKKVNELSIVLDGDFELNHVVMNDKVQHYYSEVVE